MISTCQYEVIEVHLGENAREWIGSIIVLMVRLQPSTRSPSPFHMECPMWTQTIKMLERVKISALRCGVSGEIHPMCFRRPANPRFMGAGENRPGAVAVEQVLEPQFHATSQHTPCSGGEWIQIQNSIHGRGLSGSNGSNNFRI